MFLNHDSRVAGDVAGNFLLSFFVNETAEAPHINIMAVRHVGFYNIEEGLNGSGDIGFVDSCFLCDLVDNVCFGHKKLLKGRKVNGQLFKRKMNLLIIMQMTVRR